MFECHAGLDEAVLIRACNRVQQRRPRVSGMLVAVQLLAKGCPGAGGVCIGGGEGVDTRVDGARGTVSGQGDVVLVDIERFKQVVGEMVETCVGVGQPRINEGESDGKRGAFLSREPYGVLYPVSTPRATRMLEPM